MRYISSALCAAVISAPVIAQSIHPRFEPTGESIVFYTRADEQAAIERIELSSGTRSRILDDGGYYGNPGALGGVGHIVLAGSPGGMRSGWDVYALHPDGSIRQLTDTPEREMHASASPDGTAIVFVRFAEGAAHLVERDLESGIERPLTAGDDRHFHPKYSADGRWIYFDRTTSDGHTGIYRIERANGTREPVFSPSSEGQAAFAPAPSPDGRSVAFTLRDRDSRHLAILDLTSGELDHIVSTRGDIGGAHFSPDGSELVFHREVGTGYAIEMINVASRTVRTLVSPDD